MKTNPRIPDNCSIMFSLEHGLMMRVSLTVPYNTLEHLPQDRIIRRGKRSVLFTKERINPSKSLEETYMKLVRTLMVEARRAKQRALETEVNYIQLSMF